MKLYYSKHTGSLQYAQQPALLFGMPFFLELLNLSEMPVLIKCFGIGFLLQNSIKWFLEAESIRLLNPNDFTGLRGVYPGSKFRFRLKKRRTVTNCAVIEPCGCQLLYLLLYRLMTVSNPGAGIHF